MIISLLIFPACSDPDASAGADISNDSVMSSSAEDTVSTAAPTTVPTIETTALPTTDATTPPTTEATTPPATESTTPPTDSNGRDYTLNNNTMKFHYPSCRSAGKIKEENKAFFHGTRDELIARGYSPCGNCHP